MAKKLKKDEPLTVDDSLLEEEERKALEDPFEDDDSDDLEKGDKDEEGKEDDDQEKEVKDQEGDETPEEKAERERKEREEKEGDGGDKDGDEDPLKDAKPVKIEINGEIVEGWKAKSGKYIIPYPDVEKRDEARRTLKTANEALEAANRALMVQLNEARAKPAGEVEKAEELDFEEMGKKLYESEEGAAEVLKKVHEAGRQAERDAHDGDASDEGKGREAPSSVDPAKIAQEVESKLVFKKGLEQILEEHPKLNDPKAEFICYQLGMKALGEKMASMEKEAADEWVTNAENLLTLVKTAAEETLELMGGATGGGMTEEDKKKWEDTERKKIVDRVVKDLNLSEQDRRTLGEVGDGGTPADANIELDNLEGEELEEALLNLDEDEKRKYLEAKSET